MVRKAQIEIKKELRGGKGEVEFHHILTQEELNGHGSMYDPDRRLRPRHCC